MATKKKAAKKVTRLVIVRRRWWRGQGGDTSALRRESDGKQCCLGFYARACGIRGVDIEGVTMPTGVYDLWPKEAHWLFGAGYNHSADADDLANINDNNPDEKSIARIFAKHGVKVVFR